MNVKKMKRTDSHGRGSVSRAFRYLKKREDKKFVEKLRRNSIETRKRRKIKINNRCIDCNKLISPDAIRCKVCSIKRNRLNYLNQMTTLLTTLK